MKWRLTIECDCGHRQHYASLPDADKPSVDDEWRCDRCEATRRVVRTQGRVT